MTPERMPTTRELLAFYLEAGVDCALSEDSIDRLAEKSASEERVAPINMASRPLLRSGGTSHSPSPANSVARQGMSSETTLPDVAVSTAREAARAAKTLDELRTLLEAFDGCALKFTATQLVFADGNPQARIMFVGEAPGRDEDLEGRPFVGRSGKLLDLMIGAIGLDRSNVYIANVIPWRPPGNRTPTPQETQICLPFIERQIELINPDIVVTMGNPSTQTLLKTRDGIMKTRGKWISYNTGTRTVRVMPTFHPAYLLRSPSYKRLAWQDFRAIKKALLDTV